MALPYASIVVRKESAVFSATSVFKLYLVSIIGRAQAEKYEWERAAYGIEAFRAQLPSRKLEGIGFIVAFPHVVKVFRFGPKPETNLHARAFVTPTWENIPLEREGWCEVACAAEMEIAADEFAYWAQAQSVEDYLKRFSERGSVKILDSAKLERYLAPRS